MPPAWETASRTAWRLRSRFDFGIASASWQGLFGAGGP
jgi:hypothetical protein